MKIKRTRLIELVNKRIAEIETDNARRKLVDEENRERQRLAYIGETSEHWEEFARRILDTVIDDKPVTTELVPRRLKGHYVEGLRFWDDRRPAPAMASTRDLRTLAAFLEVALDDEINTTALERQGFPLGKVLRGMA